MEEPNEGDHRRPMHHYITAVYDGTGPNRVLVGWKVRIRGYEWLVISVFRQAVSEILMDLYLVCGVCG